LVEIGIWWKQAVLKVIFSSILDGHLTSFPPDVKLLAKATVDSSIELYEKISAEMLPTPAKSHYTFNLRDLSKVSREREGEREGERERGGERERTREGVRESERERDRDTE
jgi:hypothetical protein